MAHKPPPPTAEEDTKKKEDAFGLVAARNLLQPTGTPTMQKPSKSKSSTRSSSDRHVSPYECRDKKRRKESPQRRRDSPKKRKSSPYRRRESSRRSRSRNRSRSRSDSPKSSRHYRSPKPSSSRYDATKTAEYLEHYKGTKETSYFSKTDSRRYSQAEEVYVSRCKQTYSQRALPSSATVTENNDTLIKYEDVDKLDEIGAVTEAKTPEPEERPVSPPVNRINIEIKVRCTKNTKDVQKKIEEDRDFLNTIRLGKIPKKTKTMPKPLMLDSTGAIKKETPDPERERQKQKEYERIRKILPKPIIEDTKMIKKELYDINEIIQIDDNDDSRPKKSISPNPRFVLPVIKITKQMKPHTDKVDSSMWEKLFGILRKILRLRIKLLLTDITYYIPTSAIRALYRESYSIKEDSELVNSVITDINEGKFDDFEPSDDEYECAKSGKRKGDNANIKPYVASKKRKIDEKNIDLFDEEGNVNSTASATKSSTDMPPEVAHVDDIEIKEEITDIEQEIKEEYDLSEINVEDFNMQLKEEVNIANVTNEPEKQINTQLPTAIHVKTEPDAVISIVKTETFTNDLPVTEEAIADIGRSQYVNKMIENIVKPDPDASPKMTENIDQKKLDSFVQNVKNKLELVQGSKQKHEKTKTQSSSKNTDEKISNKPKDTNKLLSITKHASSKNSDTSKKHKDVAKKISSTVKEKKEKKSKKSNNKEKDENGDRTKTYQTDPKRKSKEKDTNGDQTNTNAKSDAGTKQQMSEATNTRTDKDKNYTERKNKKIDENGDRTKTNTKSDAGTKQQMSEATNTQIDKDKTYTKRKNKKKDGNGDRTKTKNILDGGTEQQISEATNTQTDKDKTCTESKNKKKDGNGDRTKTNTKSVAGTKQKMSEATNTQTDKDKTYTERKNKKKDGNGDRTKTNTISDGGTEQQMSEATNTQTDKDKTCTERKNKKKDGNGDRTKINTKSDAGTKQKMSEVTNTQTDKDKTYSERENKKKDGNCHRTQTDKDKTYTERKNKKKDGNGDRTKKNTKSDAGTKQQRSEATNTQTDKDKIYTERKNKKTDENGDRPKTNTKSDSGKKQRTSEATNMQADNENPEQQNIVKGEKVEQDECLESIEDFVSLVTNVVVVD